MKLLREDQGGIFILVEDKSDALLVALAIAGARGTERVTLLFNKGSVALETVPFAAGFAKGTGHSFQIEGVSTKVMEALAPFLARL